VKHKQCSSTEDLSSSVAVARKYIPQLCYSGSEHGIQNYVSQDVEGNVKNKDMSESYKLHAHLPNQATHPLLNVF
jgi:hypothetical protein